MSDETDALATGVKATVEAALEPMSDLIRKIAGPAADELGLTFAEHVRHFRLKRELRLWSRAKEMLEQAGIPPKQVPLKLLLPLIHNAELEDDDALQDKWAALLANSCRENSKVRSAFVVVLNQLSAEDAVFLDRISVGLTEEVIQFTFGPHLNLLSTGDSVILENVSRLGIIHSDSVTINNQLPRHWITKFGAEFIRACRAPEPSN